MNSAPDPDRIVNFWWKKVVSRAFQAIANTDLETPLWFAEGKTSLLQKPGEYSSENQRPITYLNTIYMCTLTHTAWCRVNSTERKRTVAKQSTTC